MRVKLSGSAEFVKAVEKEAIAFGTVSMQAPPQRREAARFELGLKEIWDIVVNLKDLAELGMLVWAGIQTLRASRATAATAHSSAVVPPADHTLKFEVTSPRGPVEVIATADSSREEIERQLAPLRP